MKRLPRGFLLLLLVLLSRLAGAQRPEFCGTPRPSPDVLEQYQRWARTLRTSRTTENPPVFIPVTFTFVRPASAAGQPLTTRQQDDAFRNLFWLERFYRTGNLHFFVANLNTLDNDADFNREWYTQYDATLPQRLPKNAANVVVVPRLALGVAGYAYYPSPGQYSNLVVVGSDYFGQQDNLVPHEMGHYLNLIHTHEWGDELANGSNCATAGDRVCDTPADPYGKPNATSSRCSYTGTATDANGQAYTPDLNNLMGYWHTRGCQTDRFTPEQLERAYAGFLYRKNNPGSRETYYDFSAAPNDLTPTNLRVVGRPPGTNQVNVKADWNTRANFHSQILVERAPGPDGPWTPVHFFYVPPGGDSTFGDRVPDPQAPWYYRARHGTSQTYSNVARYEPRQAQVIAFDSVATQTFGAGPLTLRAATSSGLPVQFSLLGGPAQLSGNQVTFTDYGQVRVRASQPGNDQFLPAADVTRTFCVNPAPPRILSDSASLLTLWSNSSLHNQWFLDGDTLRGAVAPSLTVTRSGEYAVEVRNPDPACRTVLRSQAKRMVITTLALPAGWKLEVSPNPASDVLTVRLSAAGVTTVPVCELLDAWGRVVLGREIAVLAGRCEAVLPVRTLAAGVYLVRVRAGGWVGTSRVLVGAGR